MCLFLGVAEDVRNYILRDGISEIVVTSNRELSGEIFQAVMDAYERGVVITPMPILYERLTERVPVEHVGSHWTVVLPMQGTSVFQPLSLFETFDGCSFVFDRDGALSFDVAPIDSGNQTRLIR
jgi:hypothetical protein